MIQDWSSITLEALQNAWGEFLSFIPLLIGAIIVFLIGWLIATGVGKLVAEVLTRLQFNKLFEKTGWKGMLERAELKVNASQFIGGIIKWLLVIVFLLVAVKILGLFQLADFLNSVLVYLPNVVIAALIFVVTVIVTDIIEKIVRATVEGFKVGYGKAVSAIVKWSIWIFSVLAILAQLGIAESFMETLFTGVVAMMVIAAGLAFGLGGKEAAADLIQNLRKKLKE